MCRREANVDGERYKRTVMFFGSVVGEITSGPSDTREDVYRKVSQTPFVAGYGGMGPFRMEEVGAFLVVLSLVDTWELR